MSGSVKQSAANIVADNHSFLCQNQYQGGTATYGCFCEAAPKDTAACATCLGSNNAASL